MSPPALDVMTRTKRHPILVLTLACLVVLLLAQALIGALSLAALNRLMAQTTADRLEQTARGLGADIQNGMRLGKPLAQFFGLQELVDNSLSGRDPPDVRVTLMDGTVLARRRTHDDIVAIDPQALLAMIALDAAGGIKLGGDLLNAPQRMSSGAIMMAQGDSLTVAVPLTESGGRVSGAVLVDVDRYGQAWLSLIVQNLLVLAAITGCVGLMLAAALKYWMSGSRGSRATLGNRARFVLPLIAILLAQSVYAAFTIHLFRSVWLEEAQKNAATLAGELQSDINRILGYGLQIGQLRGVEGPFARMQSTFPAIGEIALLDAQGRVVTRTRTPDMPQDDTAELPDFSLPLTTFDRSASAGFLAIRLNRSLINEGVRSRVLDALTVSTVALVTAMEMLLLLSLLLGRQSSAATAHQPNVADVLAIGDAALVGRLSRPVMFAFLFAWALPLSFLPVYARTLPADMLSLPPNLLLALPISVEMFCGLITALLAGRLTDRKGWQTPVLSGLLIAALGMMACAWASALPGFVAARGLVGLGYGLTWMGLQGFIVTHSPPQARGRNMTGVIAGLFAGHLSGAAVGAMLAEQTGYHTVFVFGALMLALPLACVMTLMRPYMQARMRPIQPAPQPRALAETLSLLSTRDFGLLLIGSIIPFSIAQVGVITYALPLYLEAQGAAASSVGRILMIYGLCVIYVGPMMGRLADRSVHKKKWIVAGGITGSAGLLALYANGGVMAAALAVFMLALASCMSGAAQSPYMLGLPHVQSYGAAAATSVMRAADKLGQMAGPLIVGSMFGLMGMGAGLAVTGAIYLCATLAFWLFAHGARRARPA